LRRTMLAFVVLLAAAAPAGASTHLWTGEAKRAIRTLLQPTAVALDDSVRVGRCHRRSGLVVTCRSRYVGRNSCRFRAIVVERSTTYTIYTRKLRCAPHAHGQEDGT
jgi:hypothetical protein